MNHKTVNAIESLLVFNEMIIYTVLVAYFFHDPLTCGATRPCCYSWGQINIWTTSFSTHFSLLKICNPLPESKHGFIKKIKESRHGRRGLEGATAARWPTGRAWAARAARRNLERSSDGRGERGHERGGAEQWRGGRAKEAGRIWRRGVQFLW